MASYVKIFSTPGHPALFPPQTACDSIRRTVRYRQQLQHAGTRQIACTAFGTAVLISR
ncbi:hypothetical protein M3O57_03495 [Xanthomonas nasturtii]|uniref:Uncharacterized protein n=1 Tax=Xanthomonas nasturtii TaxID=1843581 RepID=A0ABT0LL95_9XANT|nr:hypothetical protein [Xanthomonas nasturtii]MCL1530642.1 hypothetical protein [Xanthomonas nasturtii]MCL1550114.1 hypothetical protein [Xanthomonas nasturtii]MCL1554199.1 hypothetical protein [Xanthomonas nasturtii]MCL1559719.1 hypothetical protein [Xanthomonas nasturtii]MCL1563784.1 hypothetical protein [Xanthomonas nasturtii]